MQRLDLHGLFLMIAFIFPIIFLVVGQQLFKKRKGFYYLSLRLINVKLKSEKYKLHIFTLKCSYSL